MRWIRFTLLLFLFQQLFATSSFANPEETQALTLSWQSLNVVTSEGVDVALAVIVNGAEPNEQIDIDATYGTLPGSASSNSGDYEGVTNQSFKITGLNRVHIITIDVNYNNGYEPYQDFKVELRSSEVLVTNGSQATVGIYRKRLFNSFVGLIQSCSGSGEPENNHWKTSGVINTYGGWCDNDFSNEVITNSDYYHFNAQKNGNAIITLENRSNNQHDFNLYVYADNGGPDLTFLQQSSNPNQQTEQVTVPVQLGSRYVIRVYWHTNTGNNIPLYRLNVVEP